MSEKKATTLVLSELEQGIPALSQALGKVMAECCAVCLDNQNHSRGLIFKVALDKDGKEAQDFIIQDWVVVTEDLKRCWRDLNEATELAASGIAILLILKLTEFTTVERAVKTTGIDYWLGKKEDAGRNIFKRHARLEISGLLSGTESQIRSRVRYKLKQAQQSDYSMLPAFIIVVEFSNLLARVVRK
ncbi:MAG: hypothetical protein WCS37_20165 [Chloroflexota bacterium]|nr:hypothetical protein [Chloroflexota bacterium]